MRNATFTEFRQHAKTYFDAVEKGETIRIIRYGKVIAQIIPATNDEVISSWKKPGLKMVIKGISLAKLILKERKASKG